MHRFGRKALSPLVCAVVVTGVCQAVAVVEAPNGSPALAVAGQGTGGVFVPAQGRVLDTRPAPYTVGPYTTPMAANTWRTVQVGGVAGVPTNDVSAVQITLSVAASGVGSGYLSQDLATPKPVLALSYGNAVGSDSNTSIVAVSSSGNIKLETTTSANATIDVQGYYTAGDDTAAGGYVPVATPTRIVDTRSNLGVTGQLAKGSTTTVQVSGNAGVPSNASAVFVNFTMKNVTVNAAPYTGYFTPYAADVARPTVAMTFPDQALTSLGTTVPLSADGKINVFLGNADKVDLIIEIAGYFDPTAGSGAFTPATVNITSNVAIANHATATIAVAGVNGVPLAGSGISAAALMFKATTSDAPGSYLTMWASTDPQPGTSSLNMVNGRAGTVSNFAAVKLGSDGKIKVYNSGPDNITLTVGLQGWYSNVGRAISNGQTGTQQSVTLQADATAGGSWVTYQYRVGTVDGFTNVPVPNVKDNDGNPPKDKDGNPVTAWPAQKSSGAFTAYTWNIRDTLAALAANNGVAPDALVQVQACLGSSGTDTSPVCGTPSNINFAQNDGGDASTDIGPGSLSELTGNFQLNETDADAATALGSLSVGRTLSTLRPAAATADAAGVFGPGWTADLTGPDGGAADLAVTDSAAKGYVLLTSSDGSVRTYQATGANTVYPQQFAPSGDDAGDGSVVTKADAATITLTESDGTVTTWKKAGTVWSADSVKQPGSNATTTYTYGTGSTAGLVTRILAPVPAGASSCTAPDTTAGCRSLLLNYASVSTGSGTAMRLSGITLSIPQTSSENKIIVASYDFDSAGRLAHAWDPRITPALKTAYTYTAANRLATLTPPGLAAWSLAYDSTGRLQTASRPDPSGSTATTTVVYDVPFTPGSNDQRPDLTGGTAATWGQVDDLPATATAVFGPDRTPAGTTAADVTNADWPFASIDYIDVNARTVNTAAYGAGAWQIATTQYNSNGNTSWTLTPGNRAQALRTPADPDTDTYVAAKANVARAALLTSATSYDPLHPTRVTDTYGPTHPITLSDGTAIHGRSHVATSYDDGAPNSDINPATSQAYDLPTAAVTSAYRVDGTPGDTTGADTQTTLTGYDLIGTGGKSGWELGSPTSSSVVMPGATDLVTKTRYDDNGRIVEQRLPNDTSGNGPRTTLTAYYTATGTGGCVDPTRVGLMCSVTPAGQPSSGSPLPVTTYSYDQYGNPTDKIESFGSGSSQVVRRTATGYDAGERPTTSTLTVTPTSAGGTTLPAVTTGYSATTGLPTATSTTAGGATTTLTTGYDNLGRKITYTDATGNVSTTTYDLSGNTATVNNGKHVTSYTTDGPGAGEHRGLTTGEDLGLSSDPSTFAVAYDPAGNMSRETYPNGVVATRRYDNAGNLFSLTYAKDGSTWMAFSQDVNALGQIVHQTSPQSAQTFGYDPADRLTTVQDTYQSACTTRSYSFDTHSNRTKLVTNPAGSNGSCATTTTPANASYNYDDADRLTSDAAGSYSYDRLGRAEVVPAGDAKSTGSRNAVTGNLTVGYHANDMVASQQQGSSSISFSLDPLQDRISTQVEGSTTTTNHYLDDSDSPAWTATGSTTTEYATDPAGDLAVTIQQGGTVTLNLANPHGDIVATCPDLANATGTSSYNESTEFGAPRDAATAYSTYGWVGGKQRSTNDLGGLLLMGARLYNPVTSRFVSVDPIPGGTQNAYSYPTDPLTGFDLSGQCWCDFGHWFSGEISFAGHWWGHQASRAWHGATSGLTYHSKRKKGPRGSANRKPHDPSGTGKAGKGRHQKADGFGGQSKNPPNPNKRQNPRNMN